jgi:hypothetical protein
MKQEDTMETKNSQEMARELLKFVNSCGVDGKGFAVALASDHPTLQQSVMRLFLDFATEMSKKQYTDLRNEASVALAKKIVNLDAYLPLV